MKHIIQLACKASLFLSFFSASIHAATIHDEGIDGDLSGLMGTPTPLSVSSPGVNTIIGQIGDNGNTGATDGSDADYLTFNIPSGFLLSAIMIDQYISGEDRSFFGYTAGTSFSGQGVGDVDGFTLFGLANTEVLDDLNGAPLPAGDYAFWLQETADGFVVDYQVSFHVTAVPLPGAAWLFGSALLALVGVGRKSATAGKS